MNQIPHKLANTSKGSPRYIYIVRLGKPPFYHQRPILYKIGFTNNILKRMKLLMYENSSPVEIVSCGLCRDYRDVEKSLHDLCCDHRYSFIKEENYCKWCYEYYNFNDGKILYSVINLMNLLCYNVVIFEDPKPRVDYNGSYKIVDGIMTKFDAWCES